MQISAINNSDINFGHKLPNKKTYRAMQGYYEVINDKGTAMEYRMLDLEAKARRHFINYIKAQSELIDTAEAGVKDSNLKFALKLGKLGIKSVYERLASIFYYCL